MTLFIVVSENFNYSSCSALKIWWYLRSIKHGHGYGHDMTYDVTQDTVMWRHSYVSILKKLGYD